MSFFTTNTTGNYDKLAYDFNFNALDGNQLSLSQYKNKIIVAINVASQCGFTNQYEDMQKIWERYQKDELILIGVPSNDFGKSWTSWWWCRQPLSDWFVQSIQPTKTKGFP